MEIQELRNAIESINLGYLTKSEFINRDCFEHEDMYYSLNNYVVLHNGEICENDYATYCEYYEAFYHSDDVYIVNIYKSQQCYSIEAIEYNDLVCVNGEYFDEDALEYNGYNYLEDLGTYSDEDAYWHESEGAYYSYPERSCNFTRSYHNGTYKEKNFNFNSQFKIGYEIEKEDLDVLESIDIEDFECETNYLWRKEEDSSLDDNSGFELISPTFELDTERIFELINSNPILVAHINSNHSLRCGGHINLSQIGLNGEDVFNQVCGYTPLLYSLYYGRVDKNYSKGKSNKDLKNENQKYQAIRIHDNRIEFRIFSAVQNVETLLWRTKLIEKMLQYPTSDVRTAYWHIKTKFKELLAEMYDKDKMEVLKNRIITNTLKFEGVDLTKTIKNDNNKN